MDSQYLETDQAFDPNTKQVVEIDDKRYVRVPGQTINQIKKGLKMSINSNDNEERIARKKALEILAGNNPPKKLAGS